MGYEIFNTITCITLAGNTKRQDLAKKNLNGLGINFEFYIAQKHPKGGRIGCFDSHINVIREAYNKRAQRILIFEDDVIPSPGYSEQLLNKATEFMKKTTDWNIFQLGWVFNVVDDKLPIITKLVTINEVSPNIFDTIGLGGHAYCLSYSGIKKIIDNYEQVLYNESSDVIHYDKFLVNIFKDNAYSLAPIIFDQHWCLQSDNIPYGLLEKYGRKFQCITEVTKIMYVLSLLFLYRKEIVALLLSIILIFVRIIIRYYRKS
jgi:GR25 family glycosyltransferase involved in LPS biosynthesis